MGATAWVPNCRYADRSRARCGLGRDAPKLCAYFLSWATILMSRLTRGAYLRVLAMG
jgi:hypothetical protein